MTLSLLAYFTYIFIDIIICLEEHVMILENILDGDKGPLLEPPCGVVP
jgi:hypothetical protein